MTTRPDSKATDRPKAQREKWKIQTWAQFWSNYFKRKYLQFFPLCNYEAF